MLSRIYTLILLADICTDWSANHFDAFKNTTHSVLMSSFLCTHYIFLYFTSEMKACGLMVSVRITIINVLIFYSWTRPPIVFFILRYSSPLSYNKNQPASSTAPASLSLLPNSTFLMFCWITRDRVTRGSVYVCLRLYRQHKILSEAMVHATYQAIVAHEWLLCSFKDTNTKPVELDPRFSSFLKRFSRCLVPMTSPDLEGQWSKKF